MRILTRPGARSTLLGRPPRVKPAAGALGLLAMLVACSRGPALQPAGPAAASGAAGAIVRELSGLRISVTAGVWQGRPRALPDHVLPFLVVLRNTGTRPVAVSRGDFLLLDDANRQYLPLAPTEVVSLLGGSASSGVSVSPSIGIGGSTGGGGTIFGGGVGISLGGGYASDVRDVIPRALPEGPLQPGAEAQGFLYFPRPAAPYELLRFVAAPR
ncbi:MAG: hypothetical protein ACE147_05005, partial [Candidatus Methylomirabilales bacterium]